MMNKILILTLLMVTGCSFAPHENQAYNENYLARYCDEIKPSIFINNMKLNYNCYAPSSYIVFK